MFGILIAGWGKNAKEVAYLGVLKCDNCKNHSHFSLYEVANKVTVYFIPVARFNKKNIIGCSICECGWEIDETSKQQLLRENMGTPSKEIFISIWDEISDEINERLYGKDDSSIDLESVIEEISTKLKRTYTGRHVETVMMRFLGCAMDTDKPE